MKKVFNLIIFAYLILFIYALTTITYKTPHYELHKGHKTHIVAHRGYSSLARENSLKSLEIANKSDCVDLLEIDVRLTKDNVLVLSHNNKILKLGKKKFNVSNTNYDIIKNIKLIDKYDLPLNEETLNIKLVAIPTLLEALKKINKIVIIDIKYNKNITKLNKELLSIIDEFDNVILQSTSLEGLNDIHKRNEFLKCQLIIDSHFDYINIPNYIYGICVRYNLIDIDKIKELNNKKIFVWTINDIKTYKEVLSKLKLISNRVYFITDYPELLCTYDNQEFLAL